jgi:hypothetical protein
MSSAPANPTAQACLKRAIAAQVTGKMLREAGDEWFAVCYFYAAYHTVKAAFIEDPVFDDVARLAAKSPHLIMEDRFAESHHGRVNFGTRRLGVNDIVAKLYPDIAVEYVRLHMASMAVRYQQGLGAISVQSVMDDYETVISAYQAGALATDGGS